MSAQRPALSNLSTNTQGRIASRLSLATTTASKLPMSSAAANSSARRASKATGARRASECVPQRKSEMRHSLAVGAARRPSIIVPSAKPATVVDPNPLSEKEQLERARVNLVTFLAQHGYHEAVSVHKFKQPPTVPEFYELFTFLARHVDPNYMRIESAEEVTLFLRRVVRYPLQMSKLVFAGCIAPHTWNALLLAMAWMLKLLNFLEEEEKAFGEGQTPFAPNNDSEFYDFLAANYLPWLQCPDEELDVLHEQFAVTLASKKEQLEGEIAHLEMQVSSARLELNGYLTSKSPLAIKQAEFEKYAIDCEKLKKILQIESQKKAQLQEKISHASQELDGLAKRQAELKQRKEELQRRVNAQTISIDDFKRLQSTNENMAKTLESMSSQKRQLQQQIWDIEVLVSQKMSAVENMAKLFNTVSESIQFTEKGPLKLLHSPQISLSLNLKKDGEINTSLERLRVATALKFKAAQAEMVAVKEQMEQGDDKIAERRDAVLSLQAKLQSIKQQHKHQQETLQEQHRALVSEGEVLENQIAQLQAALQAHESQLTHTQLQEQQLADQFAELCKTFDAENGALIQHILAMSSVLAEFKIGTHNKILELEKQAQQLLTNVRQ
eukprot:gnl/Hemi2/6874_TR2341_c0_g1_i1.p1 gnl/Hemi2/6874_TR2341_c0_g1~~gnl/Hemi2/6874_TR2341_c0_g1_i1.p1  ORF type:complete len:613 (-),score=208.59 gnl/Hemi2/6874_TR2341_c0_g1_i1:68-1906(-)